MSGSGVWFQPISRTLLLVDGHGVVWDVKPQGPKIERKPKSPLLSFEAIEPGVMELGVGRFARRLKLTPSKESPEGVGWFSLSAEQLARLLFQKRGEKRGHQFSFLKFVGRSIFEVTSVAKAIQTALRTFDGASEH